ncbi:MAG: penicillin acylase family protein [Gammaproteobacteria bacterium]|nr:penicillin acylase family protein [Gammaproteobacteria bacterium]
MLKKLFFLIFFVFIFLTLFLSYVYLSVHNARPVQLLNHRVTIHWDKHGVPHVLAQQEDADAFFALGYLHAHDRFWQMEFQRRIASGTLSEIFGEKTLEKDKFLRTFGFYRATQQSWSYLDSRTKYIVQRYTDGVNAFLTTQSLPLEFKLLRYQPKPWTVIDSLCWEKMMAFDLQNQWSTKIQNYQLLQALGEQHYRELVLPYPQQAPTVLSSADLAQAHLLTLPKNTPPQYVLTNLPLINEAAEKLKLDLGLHSFAGKGSNAWVVSGKRTTSGKPLLANDPHLSLQAPAVWYLVELQGPSLHIQGASIPGLPSILIGHNDHIAWGVTNINPDTQDLYIEPPSTALSVRHEIIKIKHKPDLDFPVFESAHGPIISQIVPSLAHLPHIALKWTAFLPNDTTVQSLIEINYAKNWQDFTGALQHFIVPSQNFVYADTEGNIGYSASGLIPVRIGWNGEFPVMADSQHEWAGFIPFDQLPQVYNPPENQIVTANNALTPPEYPYQITFRWAEPSLRAERILQLLQAHSLLNINLFAHIQNDTYSSLWALLRPVLLATHPLDKESERVLSRLRTWQGNTDTQEVAATLFAAWYQRLTTLPSSKVPFLQQWNEPVFILQQLQNNGYFCQPDCQAYLSHTLQEVAHHTAQRPWGKIHQAHFIELGLGSVKPLAWIWNRTQATSGGLFTVNVGTYDDQFIQTKGASYRQIIDLNDLAQSQYIQTLGQSGNPFDKHYDDLLKKWSRGEYLPMRTTS